MFTGQGSQCIGMGKDLYKSYKVVREIHEEVDECLKFSLTKLIHDGLQIDLDMTENAQPALVVHAYAVMAALNVCTQTLKELKSFTYSWTCRQNWDLMHLIKPDSFWVIVLVKYVHLRVQIP